MSYVVFARKYRPMRFADMIGQEHIGRTLGNAIKQDRVHHAYLFAGARGLGKTTTARIFAKGLVCEQGPTPEPCNECSECVAVSEGRSVDVMEIDGASNNSVDNIRNLREQVHYLPQTARRKVYIVDEVHMLTTSAFNALLKTLEEPPPHVNFVFATTEPHKVLPTILSRVNRLDFKRVAPGQLVQHLRSILDAEGLSVEEGGLRIVARAGGGSVRDALTLLDQVVAFAEDPKKVSESEVRRLLGQADVGAVHELVDAILDRDAATTLQRFDALVTAGNDLTVVSLQVLEHLRDLAVIKVCDSAQVLPDATEAELAQLRAAADKTDRTHLGQLFDRFSRTIDRLPQSRSQRMLVEMGLLDLACAEPLMPLGDLVDQLHALGSGAPPPAGGTGRSGASRGSSSRGRGGPSGRSGRASASPEASPSERWMQGREAAPERPQPEATVRSREGAGAPRPPTATTEGPSSPPEAVPPTAAVSASHPAASASSPQVAAASPPRSEAAPSPPAPTVAPEAAAPSSASFQRPANDRPALASEPDGPPSDDPRFGPPPGAAPRAAEPAPNSFAAKLFDMVRDSGAVREGSAPTPPTEPGPPEPGPAPARAPAPEPSPPAGSNGSARQAVPLVRMGIGPCTPQPPAEGTIPFESLSPFEAWEQLVQRIREGDEFLAAVLGEVGLVDLSGGSLKIAAPRGSFAHTELTRHPQMRAQVEQACRDHLGAPFTVELVEGEPMLPDLPSLVLVAQQRRAEHRAQVEAEARAHPGIQTLLATFDAQLVGTKPLHEP